MVLLLGGLKMTKTSFEELRKIRNTEIEEVANLMEHYQISKTLAHEIINIYFEFFNTTSFVNFMDKQVRIWNINEYETMFKDIITSKGLIDSVECSTPLTILYDDSMFVTTNYGDYMSTNEYIKEMTPEFDMMDSEDLMHYCNCIEDLLFKSKSDTMVIVEYDLKNIPVNAKTVLEFVYDNYFTFEHMQQI